MSDIDTYGDRKAIGNPEQQEPRLGDGDELQPDGYDPEEGD